MIRCMPSSVVENKKWEHYIRNLSEISNGTSHITQTNEWYSWKLLNLALNTNQSINQSINHKLMMHSSSMFVEESN